MAGPLEQFEVKPLVPIEAGGIDLSFTNSSLLMVIAVVLITALLTLGVRRRALVPDRLQSVAEVAYESIAGMVREHAGAGGRPYFPFIFSIFMFVLFGNLIGMIPGSFTFTSHLVVTLTMAMVVFVGVTIIGIARHGFRWLTLFFPHGAPLWTAVILIPIEIMSYLSRPISLSVRLFANMTVGHVMLKVIAGFIAALGVLGIVPFALLIPLTLLEFFIAALQAYIFAILTCVYLHDALYLH